MRIQDPPFNKSHTRRRLDEPPILDPVEAFYRAGPAIFRRIGDKCPECGRVGTLVKTPQPGHPSAAVCWECRNLSVLLQEDGHPEIVAALQRIATALEKISDGPEDKQAKIKKALGLS